MEKKRKAEKENRTLLHLLLAFLITFTLLLLLIATLLSRSALLVILGTRVAFLTFISFTFLAFDSFLALLLVEVGFLTIFALFAFYLLSFNVLSNFIIFIVILAIVREATLAPSFILFHFFSLLGVFLALAEGFLHLLAVLTNLLLVTGLGIHLLLELLLFFDLLFLFLFLRRGRWQGLLGNLKLLLLRRRLVF